MRIRCSRRRCWRMISCPAAKGMRWVNPSSAMLWPSLTCAAIASRSDSTCMGLLDDGLRLLAQVLGEIVEGAVGLAGAAGALPAAKGLVPGPGAGGGALRPVRVGHARLDVLLEPGDLIARAVEAGRQPERRGVGKTHGLFIVGHPVQHQDRQEHLLLPQRVPRRRLGERRSYEETARQIAVAQLLAAGEDGGAAIAQQLHVARVVVVGGTGDDRDEAVLATRRITDTHAGQLAQQPLDEGVGDLTVYVQARQGGAFLTAHTEGGTDDPGGRALEVGARGDDAGVLAAHLRDAGPGGLTGLQPLPDLPADLARV